MSERITDMYARVEAERNALAAALAVAEQERDTLRAALTTITGMATHVQGSDGLDAAAWIMRGVAEDALACVSPEGEA